MTQDIAKEPRVCKNPDCKREYEAHILTILGTRIIFGWGYCPECAKKVLEEEEAREESMKLEKIAHQRRRWRLTCGIPPKFMTEEFGTFDKERQLKAYEKCLGYANNYPLTNPRGYSSLLLFSEHSWGVGKTHLVCSIAHHILGRWTGEDTGCPVLFISEPDLYMRITATYNYSLEEKSYRESETDIIKQLTAVGLLILDDVGKRRVTDPRFVQRIMFSIIDGRYKAILPMVLTANLDPERLRVYLGGGQEDEATFDRLLEMTGGKFLEIEGESYRRK